MENGIQKMKKSPVMKKQKWNYVVPDGGWGWMVCMGGVLITLSLRSVDPCFGLLFGDLLKDLKVESTGASMIMSVFQTVSSLSGMVVGPLIKKFTCRKVSIFGSLLGSIGLILTSRANSLPFIICTYSILGGLGMGFAITSSFVSLNTYFKVRRTQVVGLSTSGTALGMMCMPQIVHFLMMQYDFRGTALIIGALALHAVVGSCLFQPVARHMIPVLDEEDAKLVSNDTKNEGDTLLKLTESREDEILRKISMSSNALDISTLDLTQEHWKDDEAREENVDEHKEEKSFVKKLVHLFDLKLLADPVYLNIMLGLGLINEAEMHFRFILPFFLTSIGMSNADIASAISLSAFADIIARLTIPTIFLRFKFKNRNVLWISAILFGIIRSIIAGLMPGKLLMAAILVNGFLRGTAMTNFDLTVSEHCSIEMLPSALGIVNVVKGLCIIILGPAVGFIRDKTGSYEIAINTMSGFIAVCSITWGLELLLRKIRTRKNNSDNKTSGENTIS